MQQLKCCHQEYDWGQTGEQGLVGRLVKQGLHLVDKNKEEVKFNADAPFAELWMGTHKNGPSFLYNSKEDQISESLKDFIHKQENDDLPFLFKVLSVRKPLSIQTHPTKEQAQLLHARDPKNYPDDNHKPEMAIAVTEFGMLCGFAPWNKITENIAHFPELQKLCKVETTEGDEEHQLKTIFSSVWKSAVADITTVVEEIMQKIHNKNNHTALEEVMVRLYKFFPGDVGVLAPIFMNFLVLQPGQAVYLGANVPHAYLFGDCIECMACSDNTIRAGLTPKYKDVDTLCGYMNWKMGTPPFVISAYETCVNPALRIYAVDTQKEFMIKKWEPASSEQKSNLYHPFRVESGTNSIWVVLRGTGVFIQAEEAGNLEVRAGDVVFKPSSPDVVLIASPDFLAYSALVPNTEKPSDSWESPAMKAFRDKVEEYIRSISPDDVRLPL